MTLIETVAVAVALATGRKEATRSPAGGAAKADAVEARKRANGVSIKRVIS